MLLCEELSDVPSGLLGQRRVSKSYVRCGWDRRECMEIGILVEGLDHCLLCINTEKVPHEKYSPHMLLTQLPFGQSAQGFPTLKGLNVSVP